jgi:hypothetical protein
MLKVILKSAGIDPAGAGGFKPTMRLDVYDHYVERKGGAPKKVAEVLSDGKTGQVQVLDAQFRSIVNELFAKPLIKTTGSGFVAHDRSIGHGQETLPPYRADTLKYVSEYGLPIHNLRGEMVQLEAAPWISERLASGGQC